MSLGTSDRAGGTKIEREHPWSRVFEVEPSFSRVARWHAFRIWPRSGGAFFAPRFRRCAHRFGAGCSGRSTWGTQRSHALAAPRCQRLHPGQRHGRGPWISSPRQRLRMLTACPRILRISDRSMALQTLRAASSAFGMVSRPKSLFPFPPSTIEPPTAGIVRWWSSSMASSNSATARRSSDSSETDVTVTGRAAVRGTVLTRSGPKTSYGGRSTASTPARASPRSRATCTGVTAP